MAVCAGKILVALVALVGIFRRFLCFIKRQLWAHIIKIPDKFAATIWRKVAWDLNLIILFLAFNQQKMGFRWANDRVLNRK